MMSKDIIIFVNAIRPATFAALKMYEVETGRHFIPVVFVDEEVKKVIFECNGQNNLIDEVEVLTADFASARSIRDAIKPIEDRVFAVTAQYENCIEELRQLIPYFPYLSMPTEESLIWATEKKLMRKLTKAYDSSLVPKYIEFPNTEPTIIKEVEASLSYPMVVKPSGLEGSLLVSHVGNQDELKESLGRIFSQMQSSYDTWVKRQDPILLVEEFMVGDMYTIDVYINAQGICYYTPIVEVIVGRQVGYDDLFGYKRSLPANLEEIDEQEARKVARSACKALGLRSVTAHVELMKTSGGWMIIELGPRIGGYRHDMFKEAYGINHIVNDVLNRADEKPRIPTKLEKYVAAFDIYARTEGNLKKIHGLENIKDLASFTAMKQNLFPGDQVLFAKNGGDAVVNIMLSHSNKIQLDADCRAMEAVINFDVDLLQD